MHVVKNHDSAPLCPLYVWRSVALVINVKTPADQPVHDLGRILPRPVQQSLLVPLDEALSDIIQATDDAPPNGPA